MPYIYTILENSQNAKYSLYEYQLYQYNKEFKDKMKQESTKNIDLTSTFNAGTPFLHRLVIDKKKVSKLQIFFEHNNAGDTS